MADNLKVKAIMATNVGAANVMVEAPTPPVEKGSFNSPRKVRRRPTSADKDLPESPTKMIRTLVSDSDSAWPSILK